MNYLKSEANHRTSPTVVYDSLMMMMIQNEDQYFQLSSFKLTFS